MNNYFGWMMLAMTALSLSAFAEDNADEATQPTEEKNQVALSLEEAEPNNSKAE